MEILFNFALLGAVYLILFLPRWRKQGRRALWLKTAMAAYGSLVLYVTIMPFALPLQCGNNQFLESANFVPFIDLMKGSRAAVREAALNAAMFMPFGFLLRIIKPRGLLFTAGSAFLFSLGIETVQLLYAWAGTGAGRVFDVTDLITNTSGALLGYLLCRLAEAVPGSRLQQKTDA